MVENVCTIVEFVGMCYPLSSSAQFAPACAGSVFVRPSVVDRSSVEAAPAIMISAVLASAKLQTVDALSDEDAGEKPAQASPAKSSKALKELKSKPESNKASKKAPKAKAASKKKAAGKKNILKKPSAGPSVNRRPAAVAQGTAIIKAVKYKYYEANKFGIRVHYENGAKVELLTAFWSAI